MKIKHIIFDLDGVVITPPQKFSDKLSSDFNIPMDQITPFFQDEFTDCCLGKADLKKVLEKYLSIWKSHNSVKEILRYWFTSEDYPNSELLEYINSIKENSTKVHIASNQEKNRTEFIREKMGLKKHFNTFFISADFGVKKPDREFYQKIFDILKDSDPELEPEQIMYWDDEDKNVEAGSKFGFQSFLYEDFKGFKEKMNGLLEA